MRAAACLMLAVIAGPDTPSGAALTVRVDGRWTTWWTATDAPNRWSAANAALTRATTWRPVAPGLSHGELVIAGSGTGWRVRVIIARFDPARLTLSLHYVPDPFGRPDRWQVADAPNDALLAFNSGQFTGRGPWGWMVRNGVEVQPPGRGPLAPAVTQDTAGRMHFVAAEAIDSVRAAGGVQFAIQSYPAVLLGDGEIPEPLRTPGQGVDLQHRDARLALCELRSGEWLTMLTRFETLGGVLEMLPYGPTTPEMAAIAGGLGCVHAVLLDGGMSGQMLLRDADGTTTPWAGLRKVPAGVLLTPR